MCYKIVYHRLVLKLASQEFWPRAGLKFKKSPLVKTEESSWGAGRVLGFHIYQV